MFEKVNPYHPDKVADRIAGAIVDLAYERQENPRIAVEVLIGHGLCVIIAESSVALHRTDVWPLVERIVGSDADDLRLDFKCVPQDSHLAKNQEGEIRCGDNGIFAGYPVTGEQKNLAYLARELSRIVPHDGKYIRSGFDLFVCQSHVSTPDILPFVTDRAPGANITINLQARQRRAPSATMAVHGHASHKAGAEALIASIHRALTLPLPPFAPVSRRAKLQKEKALLQPSFS